MVSEPARRRRPHGGAFLALALVCALAWSQEKPVRSSFSCIINGKKVVSDRLIPECANSEQRELNADGSLKRVVRPVPTDDERADIERRERDEKAKVVALNDAIRRDRNLMQRFPDEAAHWKAREKALDDVRLSAKNSGTRIAILLDERKKLDEEKQFYENERVKKPLPTMLKQKIDANEASLEAQRSVSQNAQAELARINSNYDAELLRLKKLWSGTPAGSLGPLPDTRGPAAAPAASLGASKAAPSS
jgi:hypothetical protein